MMFAAVVLMALVDGPSATLVWTLPSSPSLVAPGSSPDEIDVLFGSTWKTCKVATGKLDALANPPKVTLPRPSPTLVNGEPGLVVWQSENLTVVQLAHERIAFVPQAGGPPRIQPLPANLLEFVGNPASISVSIVGDPDAGPYGIMVGTSPGGWTNATVNVTFFNADGTPAPGQVLDQAGHLHPHDYGPSSLAVPGDAYFAPDLEQSFWVGGGWLRDGRMSGRHWGTYRDAVAGWPRKESLVFGDGGYFYTVKGNQFTCWRFHPPHEGGR